uniref:FACT complex subunit SSRP1-like n=1 Tax=Erigeron canadensis TaxID=72917 RepID=UPI001CB896DE|nr:FACT complex subunit SSRP1-like [Erigeron canadensis]
MREFQSYGEITFSKENICWRKDSMTRTIDLKIGNIEKATFMEYPGGDYCLEIHSTDGYRYKFGGFEDEHVVWLNAYFESHQISFTRSQVYVGGMNWGELDLTDHHLSLVHGQKQSLMQLSLDDVSRIERTYEQVKLKFHKDGNVSKRGFYPREFVFGFTGTEEADEFKEKTMGSLRNLVEKKNERKKPIDAFNNVSIAQLRSIYNVRFYLKNLKLLGPEVKHKNEISYVVVLCLDPPLYTNDGSDEHPYLTLEGDAVGENLVSRLEDCIHEEAIRHSNYRSRDGSYAVDCSFLNEEGHLYPLDKGFLCLTTNPIHIKEVAFVKGRVGHIKVHVSLKTRQSLFFCDIKTDERHRLLDRMKQSGLHIREPQHETKISKGKDVAESSQSERPSMVFCEEAQKRLEEEGLPIEFDKLQKRIARQWDALPEHVKSYYRGKDAKRRRNRTVYDKKLRKKKGLTMVYESGCASTSSALLFLRACLFVCFFVWIKCLSEFSVS